MSTTSRIEWTDATWNPLTGCTKISPGCDHCYAETFAERFRGVPGHHFEQGFDLILRPERLDQPLRWRKPRRIFVNSMSDLFHQGVPFEFIAEVFATMLLSPQHTFQVLTKRHARMRSILNDPEFKALVWAEACTLTTLDHTPDTFTDVWPLPNVHLGVSVENQTWADIRIPALLATPAAIRWISAEPLLAPITLTPGAWVHFPGCTHQPGDCQCRPPSGAELGGFLDWVVAGGESGPGARPMAPAWVRGLRDQCAGAGVAFLFKQWGAWAPTGWTGVRAGPPLPGVMFAGPPRGPYGEGEEIRRMSKHAAGRVLDGRTHDDYPDPQSREVRR